MGSFFFFRVWRPWVGGSAKCAGTGLPTSTAYWRASREEGWVLLQIRPVQMARMIGKDGEVLRSSVEQAIPRVRPAVAFGFEYSTMPGWGRSMWCGWSTPGGGVPVPVVRRLRLGCSRVQRGCWVGGWWEVRAEVRRPRLGCSGVRRGCCVGGWKGVQLVQLRRRPMLLRLPLLQW